MNFKQSKPFKCFNIKEFLIPFSLQESLGSTYFPKEYLFARKLTTPRSIYLLGNYDRGVDIPCKHEANSCCKLVLGSYFLREYMFTVIRRNYFQAEGTKL